MKKTYELSYTAERIDEMLKEVDEHTIYSDATTEEHGLMSTQDKTKLDDLPTALQIEGSLSEKVDKVEGKGLSENDYTDAEKESVASAYHKPQSGIPKTDLASDVQASLNKADTAIQEHQDISGKADKVSNATNGNFAGLDANGNITDSGKKASDFATAAQGTKADTALQSFTETDPTVPSWAKQPNKPSYTYSEIGNTPDLSGFITKSVNDLTNYYLKSETYTQAEINALIGAIQHFHYEIYSTLPSSGESNVLYLIGPIGSGSDRYEEYVYANNAFTKIGDTSIDLSDYVTTSALNTALADYTTTANLTTLLASKADKVQNATAGNLAGLDGNGNLTDSGKKAGDFPAKIVVTDITGLSSEQVESLNDGDVVVEEKFSSYFGESKYLYTVALKENNANGYRCCLVRFFESKMYVVYYVWSTVWFYDTTVEYDLTSYNGLTNKPQINGVTLEGNVLDRELQLNAVNLESWIDTNLTADDEQTANVFTTGGDTSIDSSVDAQLKSIVSKTDFYATKLISSGFNLLRLASNDGIATAVGTGFYFPVPAMAFGVIGTAQEVNGVLLTHKDGNNINNATVYFKPFGSGVPSSVTDGTACAYTDGTINNKTYRFYNCEQAGYMIVSGITWEETCAHLAWSKRYDEFVSPTSSDDAGSVVDLSSAIHAMHSFDQMLVVGNTSDRIDRISATQVNLVANVDKVKPSWTNTPDDQENPTSYTHTTTISGMKSGGLAMFQTANIALTIDGTNVSYVDENATANTDWVKYEKATPVTTAYNLATELGVEDWGLMVFMDAVGECYSTIAYSQGIPDNLRALVSAKMSAQLKVVAQALCELYAENQALKARLTETASDLDIKAKSIDTEEELVCGLPKHLYSRSTGAPSAVVVPDNWDAEKYGAWMGIPKDRRQEYVDANGKVYRTKPVLTGSTNDWVALN